MTEQVKNALGCIVVFVFLFIALSKGIEWWTHHKMIKDSDEQIAFAIQNNNSNKCAVISNAMSMASNLTDQKALDRYKKISQENDCSSPNDSMRAIDSSKQEAKKSIQNSWGYKLVSLSENGADITSDDPRVSALNGKIENISNTSGVSQSDIANMSYHIVKMLKEKGKSSDIYETLEVIAVGLERNACPVNVEQTSKCISSLLAYYTIARTEADQNHQVALQSLVSILDIMNDPEKRAKLEALANSNN